MITGDDIKTAKYIAKSIGITKVIANTLPENKKDEMYHDCWIHLISGYMQTTGEAAEGK